MQDLRNMVKKEQVRHGMRISALEHEIQGLSSRIDKLEKEIKCYSKEDILLREHELAQVEGEKQQVKVKDMALNSYIKWSKGWPWEKVLDKKRNGSSFLVQLQKQTGEAKWTTMSEDAEYVTLQPVIYNKIKI